MEQLRLGFYIWLICILIVFACVYVLSTSPLSSVGGLILNTFTFSLAGLFSYIEDLA